MSFVTTSIFTCSGSLTRGTHEVSTNAPPLFTTMREAHHANNSSGYPWRAGAGGLTGSARGGVPECRAISNLMSSGAHL